MGVEVLQNFLARLGFEVDEAGAAEFNSTLVSGATRVAAFGAAIQAMAIGAYAAIYQIADSKSQLLTLADAIDVPVGKLEEMGFVAEQTGSSVDSLYSSLESITEQLGGTAIGQGGLETFHRLGIDVRDANGELRDSVDVLMEVGKKLEGMDRAKATMFLGQLGIDRSLVRMLTSDVTDLQHAYREMYDAVGLDSQQAAEDSRAFVGEIKALKTMFKLLGDGVAAVFVSEMSQDVARFRKLIQENVGKIIPVLKTIIDVVLRIGKAFFGLTARLMTWVGMIVDWFSHLDSMTQTLILGVLGFGAAWRWLNLAFIATPLGAIITGLIGLLALIDDFMVWKNGGDSLIEWGPWAEDIGEVMDGLSGLLGLLGQLWDVIKGPLFEVIGLWGKHFLSTLGSILGAVASLVQAVVRLFQGDFSGAAEAVKETFFHLLDIITSTAETIKTVLGFMKDFIGDAISWAVDGLAEMVGLGGSSDNSNAPLLGPSPALAIASGGGGGGDTSISSSTVIKVDGSGSPEATARAVSRQQNRVNADLVRHTKGAAR